MAALEIEIQDIEERKRQEEAGEIILQAFNKIETAEKRYGSVVSGLTPDQKNTASEKLNCARNWIIRCQQCGLVNPINLHHCKCGAFLYRQFTASRILELGHPCPSVC